MPNPFKIPFSGRSKAVNINRGPYSMKMEDGENAEITMYGEVVETHPTRWRRFFGWDGHSQPVERTIGQRNAPNLHCRWSGYVRGICDYERL